VKHWRRPERRSRVSSVKWHGVHPRSVLRKLSVVPVKDELIAELSSKSNLPLKHIFHYVAGRFPVRAHGPTDTGEFCALPFR
jgi:hypothetical protein